MLLSYKSTNVFFLTITGREVETFENLVFDMPEIVDSTGQQLLY